MNKVTLALIGCGAIASAAACGSGFSGANTGGAASSTTAPATTTTTTTSGGGSSVVSVGAGGNGGGGGIIADTSSSSGSIGNESCFNGKDDNGDGLVDCADPQCMNKAVCQDEGSGGFDGPFILVFGMSGAAPAACPGGSTGPIKTELPSTISPADCTCGCGPSNTCNQSVIVNSVDINGSECPSESTENAPPGHCAPNTNMLKIAYGLEARPPAASGSGSCAADVVKKLGPIGEIQVGVCDSAMAGGCDQGMKCLSKPVNGERICVAKQGDASCSGEYGDKHVLYDTITDNRDCGPADTCACGEPQSADCTGMVTFYSDDMCMTAAATLPNNASCDATLFPMIGSFFFTPNAPGTCMPSGSAMPTGTVDGSNPTTFCCK